MAVVHVVLPSEPVALCGERAGSKPALSGVDATCPRCQDEWIRTQAVRRARRSPLDALILDLEVTEAARREAAQSDPFLLYEGPPRLFW